MSEKGMVLLHGKPGSGKSSCLDLALKCADLTTYENRCHFSVGNHLRSIAVGEITSQYSKQVKESSEKLGNHEPITHRIVNGVVSEFLGGVASSSLVIVDGYPKYIEQISPFEKNVRKVGINILGIMHILVPDDVALDRMISRDLRMGENNVSVISAQKRLEEHENGAKLATERLAESYRLDIIDGTKSMKDVIGAMSLILESYQD